MSTIIKIGHASISENKTAYGNAGDQTGKEVCINESFDITSLSPTVLLRPKSSALAKASALACEAGCANDNIGYSQSSRNTLYSYAKAVAYDLSKVETKCNTDCSAYITVCAIAGGANITYGTNAPTTTNMRTRFKQSGDYSVLTGSKYLTQTDYLKKGDILVCEGSHTVMVLENGSNYADEPDDPEGSGGTTGVTPSRTIRTYRLDVSVDNIKTTSALVSFKVVEITNNIEKIITNISKWSFYLDIKTLPSLETVKHDFKNSELALTNLIAGKSYMIQVIAVKNKSTAFCSSVTLFTTKLNADESNKPVDIKFDIDNIGESFEVIDKIYVKDKDKFKQAILYLN